MWIAFGQVATAGTNGELEVPPGTEYIWGQALGAPADIANVLDVRRQCPTDAIHVITSTGSATGCALTQLVS